VWVGEERSQNEKFTLLYFDFTLGFTFECFERLIALHRIRYQMDDRMGEEML
jgi:hypothetical protein